MTILIFAGGAGTRLWPLSRRNSPKQFAIFKDNKSTLQMAVDRVKSFGLENIYISTNENYQDLVQEQIPELSKENIFLEPAKKDLAAAVCLTMLRLKEKGVEGPVAIVWADHFMDAPDSFVEALQKGKNLLSENNQRFVFLGEKPRFANHNLGWIKLGKEIEPGQHEFKTWKYRPEVSVCKDMFDSGDWLWNPGYFVCDIDFVLSLYKEHAAEIHDMLHPVIKDQEALQKVYPQVKVQSFDNAILEKVSSEQAVVLPVNLGWSDPGTLYALKEAMQPNELDNHVVGNAEILESKDCLIYNEEEKKLVTAIGLDGLVVVNTKDAMIVCTKEKVPEIKKLLKQIEENNKEEYL